MRRWLLAPLLLLWPIAWAVNAYLRRRDRKRLGLSPRDCRKLGLPLVNNIRRAGW